MSLINLKTKKEPQYLSNNLSNTTNKLLLRLWPYRVKNAELNKSFKDYLISFVSPAHEHVIPFRDKILPKELKGIEKQYVSYKNNEIIQSIEKFYKINFHNKDSINDASTIEKNHLIRVSKWLRFIQNTHTNYYNLRKTEKINRITLFSEGPLANYFLTYPLSIKDTFFIKRLCFQYFKKNSNSNFVKIAKKFRINIFLIILRVSYRKLSKIKFVKQVLFSTGLISLKNKISNFSSVQKEYNFSIDIFNDLIDKNPKLFDQIKSKEIKKYLLTVLNNLDSENLNKKKLMELSRLVNLELFLNKNCNQN